MRVVFMGTPEFAIPSLDILSLSKDIEIPLVVTQPDRPAGRGKKLQESPVKKLALERNLNVLQPEKIREDTIVLNALRNCNADAFVTVAFGQILSNEILEMTKWGTINLHASLLPKYRGANPIQWSLINGDSVTGITTMLTEEKVDAGKMLKITEIPILMDDNTLTLTTKMAEEGSKLLLRSLLEYFNGEIAPVEQHHDKATRAPKLKKEMGNIDWHKSNLEIHNLIRGSKPWPGAYTYINLELLKIQSSKYDNDCINTSYDPGTIIEIEKNWITVTTGTGSLKILEVQAPNKPIVKAADWARGARVKVGTSFFSKQPS